MIIVRQPWRDVKAAVFVYVHSFVWAFLAVCRKITQR